MSHETVPLLADSANSDPVVALDDRSEAANEQTERSRRRYVLDDAGFDEVPKKYRKFYRRWRGTGDSLAPNEVLCPVCKIVIRASRELRPGDHVYCMPCMSRLRVVRNETSGLLEARVAH